MSDQSTTPCRRAFLLLCGVLVLSSPARADYDSTTMTSVLSRIDSVLAMPDLHSTLIQDSFRSGFLLNESGVEWASLGSLMFAQIRTISTSFYHLWAGFENAAFLGYYQQDTLFPNRYSIAWQTDWNHSCAYNYTNADWEVKLDVPNSGKAAVTNPFDDSNDSGNRLVPNHCREIYTANPVTGTRAKSFEGDPYDCRYRSWYFDTKRSTKNKDSKRWTSMYIDRSTNNPAFAKCAPLTNLTSKANRFFDGLKADKNGLVGVTCTGLYIVAISKQLLDLNSDISTKGSFIVERSSGLLVAASSSEISDYYSAPNVARVAASKSNNDYIRFASSSLAALSWPDGYTAVFWVTTSDAVNFPSLVEGDAYYVSVSALEAPGLTWDVVVIQKVLCKEGEYVDTVDFMCGRCATPAFSTGGAPAFCNNCVETNGGEKGYFFKSSSRTCEQCPAGATCKGLTWLPFPGQGKWVRAESEQHLSKEHMTCNEPKNCPGTINSEGGDAALACFESNQTFASCNASANERVCRKGSRGRMCGLCTTGFYLSAGEGCLSCSDPTAGSLIFFYAMIFMTFVLLYLAFQHYSWLRKQIFWKALTGKGRLKIILYTAQIVGSIQFSTQVFWGEPYRSFANMLSLFQLDFVNVLPFTCAVAYPLTHQILMSTLLPLLFLVVMRVPCFRVYGHIFSRGECINIILTCAFLVLPCTSLTLFKFYDCTKFPDGKWFLTADLTMECGTPKYRLYFSFTSFMLFVYPLGIPLAFLALLYPKREAIASRDPNVPVGGRLHKIHFLVEDYKPSHWHGYKGIWLSCLLLASCLEGREDHVTHGHLLRGLEAPMFEDYRTELEDKIWIVLSKAQHQQRLPRPDEVARIKVDQHYLVAVSTILTELEKCGGIGRVGDSQDNSSLTVAAAAGGGGGGGGGKDALERSRRLGAGPKNKDPLVGFVEISWHGKVNRTAV